MPAKEYITYKQKNVKSYFTLKTVDLESEENMEVSSLCVAKLKQAKLINYMRGKNKEKEV